MKVSNLQQGCFTVKEAAIYLRVSESIVRRLVKEKRIPYHRVYGKILFSKVELDNHIHSITIAPFAPNVDMATEKAKIIIKSIR